MSLVLVGCGHCSISICQKLYRYLAEIYAGFASTNLVDSATGEIRHPQGGNVPSLKLRNKTVKEDAHPASIE